jgi:hypothetical protein
VGGWEGKVSKDKKKKLDVGWGENRKESPISAPSIHVSEVAGAGSLWPLSDI